MAIGQELLDVPIADMVRDLAGAVAEGQLALDRASIDTLKFLADQANAIDLIPEVVEVIAPNNSNVVVNGQNVAVAGVSVTQQPTTPVKTTLLQAGLLPTFYQFTEALIEVESVLQADPAVWSCTRWIHAEVLAKSDTELLEDLRSLKATEGVPTDGKFKIKN